MKRVDVYSKDRVFDGFFKIDEARLRFERYDGEMSRPVTRLVFERGDSVAAIVVNRDSGKVLLVEQFKYPTYDNGPGWLMETVAGIVEPGESPEAAVRREVLEEIGYETDRLESIATFYVSPGGTSERILLYYVEVTDAGRAGAGGGVPSEDEDIRTIELSLEELDGMVDDGRVNDAKTLVGVLWLRTKVRSTSEL
jgi:nudix-type nucleoside diphosphatase (YffH/AdpP family)